MFLCCSPWEIWYYLIIHSSGNLVDQKHFFVSDIQKLLSALLLQWANPSSDWSLLNLGLAFYILPVLPPWCESSPQTYPNQSSPPTWPISPPPKKNLSRITLRAVVSFGHVIWTSTKTIACQLLSSCSQILFVQKLYSSSLIINLFLFLKELIWSSGLTKIFLWTDKSELIF